MNVNVEWWMYLLNAFTPLLAFGALVASKQETQKPVKAEQALPPVESAIATILTYLIMGGIFYAFWFAAHWLVFWLLNKPLHIASYFYKPLIIAYWFPYIFGMFSLLYILLVAPKIRQGCVKTIINKVALLGFSASFYMVCITYLKWLTM